MLRWFMGLAIALWSVAAGAMAQQSGDVAWVQIEARPSLSVALRRAESFARTLDDVNGFAIGGGWFAITLGPYRAEDAEQVLDLYRAEGLIPRDSYLARDGTYGARFYPPSEVLSQREQEPQAPAPDAIPEPLTMTQPPAAAAEIQTPTVATEDSPPATGLVTRLEAAMRADSETTSEARAAERAMTPEARRGLQEALQWAGFYNSAIDGAFGSGTRSAMAAWQRATGLPATGVLTTAQRALLLAQYNEVLEGLGLATYSDPQIGLSLRLPLGVVQFDRYAPPFAHFTSTGDPDAQVLLISQPGDRNTLRSLFEVMQTLEIVPLEGPRRVDGNRFTLVGRSDEIVSETRVTLADGALKGFTLVWPAGDETRRGRLVGEMARSLRRHDGVMDPALATAVPQGLDFVSGLAVRKPRVTRSGFFVTTRGAIVTTSDAVQGCKRILLDDVYEAQLTASYPDSGMAILMPADTLAPPGIARFSQNPPRLQSGVAVAGYSYEGVLGAATMTFGTLADLQGLEGEQDLNRLQLASLPGDAGGPVFDDRGNVVGMLLPRQDADRRLPQDVSFALAGSAIARAMRAAGVPLSAAESYTPLAPEDIASRGQRMTVRVSCWE